MAAHTLVCAACIKGIHMMVNTGRVRSFQDAVQEVQKTGSLLIDPSIGYVATIAVTFVNGTAYCAWHSLGTPERT